jgi:probable rRNA maturation factor
VAVELRCAAARGRTYARTLAADARRLLTAAGLARCELSVVLADDAEIRALNRRFRKQDRATDVLSFSQLEQRAGAPPDPRAVDNRAGQLLGDIVISVDTAIRQARAMKLTPRRRLQTLLIHGLLHLIGYDHERSAADARAMFARERELAAQITTARKGARAARAPRRRTVARSKSAR